MKTLSDIQLQLKNLLTQSLGDTIRVLKSQVTESSDVYNELILLESRLNDTDRNGLRGTFSNENLQLSYNQIRNGLLELIEELEEDDLDPSSPPIETLSPKADNQGNILYRVPDYMEVNQETKCVIRIAFDQETLLRNFEVDEETNIESIRVSEIMQVEILDPGSEPSFTIRTLNEKEQFVDTDSFTEWIYYVKPLQEGTFSLMLKVAVIELIRGRERKREIVLEEKVQILTSLPEEIESADFKISPHTVQLGEQSAPLPPPSPKTASHNPVQPSPQVDLPKERVEKMGVPPQSKSSKPPIYSILSVVLVLITGCWFVFSYSGFNENKGAKQYSDDVGIDNPDPEKKDQSTPTKVNKDPLAFTTCKNELPNTLNIVVESLEEQKILYDPEPGAMADASGMFLRVCEALEKQNCEGIIFPDPKKERTTQILLNWYETHDNLEFVNDPYDQADLIRPGAVMFFGEGPSQRSINAIGVVTAVKKDANGQISEYTLFHGRSSGKPASRTNYHKRSYPSNPDYPAFGNGRQEWKAVGYILTKEN